MKVISTDKAPAALGPYSQAVVTSSLVYTSGQIPLDPVTGAVVGDEVVAVGKQGSDEITLTELAQKAGTIDYELCTLLMPRVPRIYKE